MLLKRTLLSVSSLNRWNTKLGKTCKIPLHVLFVNPCNPVCFLFFFFLISCSVLMSITEHHFTLPPPILCPPNRNFAVCFLNKCLHFRTHVVMVQLTWYFLTASALLIFIGADGNERCTSLCYCTVCVCLQCEFESYYLG